jgi:hypothetical protein
VNFNIVGFACFATVFAVNFLFDEEAWFKKGVLDFRRGINAIPGNQTTFYLFDIGMCG